MAAVSTTGSFEDIKDFAAKLSSSLQYVVGARDDCTTKLGVPKEVVATEDKSDELNNSINLYESVVKNGDWLECVLRVVPWHRLTDPWMSVLFPAYISSFYLVSW